MATIYEHAWQLDVEFGKLDAKYAQELCDALAAQYDMPIGIFMDVEDEQYTALMPPPLDQPGLIYFSHAPSTGYELHSTEATILNQPTDADSASATDVTNHQLMDVINVVQNAQQAQIISNHNTMATAVQATVNNRPTVGRVRGHGRASSNRVTKTQSTHIPRPRNSWIIYRQDRTKDLRAQDESLTASEISRIVSTLWRDELPHVRAYYQRLAQEEAQAHRERYPNYRYRARRPVDRHNRVDTAAFWDSIPNHDADGN